MLDRVESGGSCFVYLSLRGGFFFVYWKRRSDCLRWQKHVTVLASGWNLGGGIGYCGGAILYV